MNPARIAQTALYQEVAERLRQRIFAHELPPGTWIDEQALAIDAGLLNEAERSALDGAIAALRSAAAGQDARAIKIQLEAFNRASNEFASRRMDKSIREALAGHKIDEIRI